ASDIVTIASGHTVTFAGTTETCAGLTITGILAAYDDDDTLTINGNVSGGGQIDLDDANPTNLILTGNYSFAGTIIRENRLNVTLNGTGAQTVTGTSEDGKIRSLTVNKTSGTATLVEGDPPRGNLFLRDGDLTVSNGTLDLSGYTADQNHDDRGTLSVAAGATLKIGGTNTLPGNYGAYSIDATSTVEYYGTNQTVYGFSYGNLTLSGSGTKTSSFAGTGTVATNNGIDTITGTGTFFLMSLGWVLKSP
ncbi:hypothetical protein ACFLVS_05165, partial [Chloroflexota bacterium]